MSFFFKQMECYYVQVEHRMWNFQLNLLFSFDDIIDSFSCVPT